jgi:predicted dehydrogenase
MLAGVAHPASQESRMTVRLGVVGLGTVWARPGSQVGPYATISDALQREGRLRVTAVHDIDRAKQEHVAGHWDVPSDVATWRDLVEDDGVDAVLVLTSMREHGEIATTALRAGKHVLVEKPMATTLPEAERLLELAADAPGVLVCAPHILLSPTYRAVHDLVGNGEIGRALSARARYGWAGPDWAPWFYQHGGGALFDLGVYNVTALCGLFGPARRVTALAGVAIPEREVAGQTVQVEAEDNAHVLMDFGEGRYAVVTTGFTMQRYRSPAIEVYGSTGTVQLLGDDWAPEGYEVWRNATGAWELHPESDPAWPWTAGLRHLVDCIESGRAPINTPAHAFHALEIMLAAQAAGRDGRAREIASEFPAPVWPSGATGPVAAHRLHDPAR